MQKLEYRDYQQECIEKLNNLADGSRVIAALATGLGKTAVISQINRKGRMLILSHRDELVRQPQKYFDCSFGIEKADEHANGEEVVSASVQTLSKDNRLEQYSPDAFDIVVVDEAHHAAAPSYVKVISYFHPRLLIGLTATPRRGDKVRLDDIFDKIIFSRDLLWGIQNQYLAPMRFMSVNTDIDISNVSFSMGDYNQTELSAAIDNNIMYTTIAKAYREHCYDDGRHTLVYCLSVEGCKGTVKAIREAIPKSKAKTIAMVTGDTPSEERHQIERDFMSGKIMCIVNCMVFTEGTDLPITDAIIVARPSANIVLYTQIVGRGARVFEGKQNCLLLDIMPQSKRTVCCASSLAGCEWENLTKEQKKKIQEEGADLEELAKEVKKAMQLRADTLNIHIQEINVFEDLYERQNSVIRSCEGQNLGAIAEAIANEGRAQIQAAKDEDGEYDFGSIKYMIGRSDEERYIIPADCRGTNIYLSKPDMLGNTVITFPWQGVCYVSSPMKMELAIDKVWYILTHRFSHNEFMWNMDVIRSWEKVSATESQERCLAFMVRKDAVSFSSSKGANKYNASVSISYMKEHEQLGKQIKELKKKVFKVSKQKADISTLQIPERKLPEKSFDDMFAVVFDRYGKKEPDPEDTVISIDLISAYYLYNSVPSEKQRDLAKNLIHRFQSRGYQSDIDLDAAVSNTESSVYLSVIVDFLKRISDSVTARNMGLFPEHSPLLCLSALTRAVQRRKNATIHVEVPVKYNVADKETA